MQLDPKSTAIIVAGLTALINLVFLWSGITTTISCSLTQALGGNTAIALAAI